MDKFIKSICEILNIKVPKISYDTAVFKTETMMAMYEMANKTLYINKEKPSLDLYFSVAHELRHVWQVENDPSRWFSNYKEANEVSVREYNLQPAEVDAHAFAMVIMLEFAGAAPQFNGLDNDVKNEIYKRARDIALELELG